MHALSWLIWVVTAATVVLSTRNPLILVLLVAEFALIADRLSQSDEERTPAISPWRFALFAIPVGAVFNGLTSHYGDTVLCHLPDAIPLLGGVVTAEAIVYGAINGLVLTVLFFAFSVLNLAVSVGELIRFVPRAFYPFAVVSAIAVSFYPNTLRQIQQVREAQAVRGHRMRGLKDWLPLFVPVLVGGLERALQLAEAMTSRGFAGDSRLDKSSDAGVTGFSLTGLVLVLAGTVLRLLPTGASWSLVLLGAGIAFMLWAMWKAGRGVQVTRYYPVMWTYQDSLAALAALAATVPALIMKAAVLAYTPYPAVAWPSFNLAAGITLLGFVVPVWLVEKHQEVSP